jgi:hypothetical protein
MIKAKGPNDQTCPEAVRANHALILENFHAQVASAETGTKVVKMKHPGTNKLITLGAFGEYCHLEVRAFCHWQPGTIEGAIRDYLIYDVGKITRTFPRRRRRPRRKATVKRSVAKVSNVVPNTLPKMQSSSTFGVLEEAIKTAVRDLHRAATDLEYADHANAPTYRKTAEHLHQLLAQ